MTAAELAWAAQHHVPPGVQLVLPRDARGRRVRLCDGVTGEVLLTEGSGRGGAQTLALFDPARLLAALGAGRRASAREVTRRVVRQTTW